MQLYLTAIERMCKSDDPLGVIVCVVPDIVHANCRPKSHVVNAVGQAVPSRIRTQRAQGQTDMFDSYDPEIYQYSVDFRRQIKARSITYGVPIQIIQESTISVTPDVQGRRGLTPPSDRAWNLGVGLYYKSGGKPWRLNSAREGVCYIGLAYRLRDPARAGRSACCAAQMFLDSGDGIVFLGEYGPWYSPERRAFHLPRGAAKRLLEGVLKTYSDLEGKPLREIFLHCRSGIDSDEFDGFRDACPKGVRIVGIRVRQERFDVRLFREGAYPVLRGTFWQVNPRKGYLWASGFKPRLGTYDGWEIPAPLRIDIQHGDADLVQVAADIFGLTKLNYNACRLGDAEPVTIGFSDAVGEILVSNPTVQERSPKLKFLHLAVHGRVTVSPRRTTAAIGLWSSPHAGPRALACLSRRTAAAPLGSSGARQRLKTHSPQLSVHSRHPWRCPALLASAESRPTTSRSQIIRRPDAGG